MPGVAPTLKNFARVHAPPMTHDGLGIDYRPALPSLPAEHHPNIFYGMASMAPASPRPRSKARILTA
jgi:hypothetical protein